MSGNPSDVLATISSGVKAAGETVVSAGSQVSSAETVMTGGSSASNPTVALDNVANKPADTPKVNAAPQASDELSYSQDKNEKKDPLVDKQIQELQDELQKSNDRMKKLRENKPHANSISDLYDVFKHNMEMNKEIVKNHFKKHELGILQDPDHPRHRGTVESRARDEMLNKRIDSQLKSDDRNRSAFNITPDEIKKLKAWAQVRAPDVAEFVGSKLSGMNSFFKPNTNPTAQSNSASMSPSNAQTSDPSATVNPVH